MGGFPAKIDQSLVFPLCLVTNTLRITLKIINNYPWTRLSVRIIGAIKRPFFHMVTHVFDNSNLSQETFSIDTWRAVIYFLEHQTQTHACDLCDYIENQLHRSGLSNVN